MSKYKFAIAFLTTCGFGALIFGWVLLMKCSPAIGACSMILTIATVMGLAAAVDGDDDGQDDEPGGY